MSFVNFSTKEITSKIVYYGPGLCGKTTTLQYIYDSIVPENKGQMVSLATDVDRTIYFDFLPLKLGKIQDFSVRIQLYTVPGQVRYNSTRKLVLSGTDGVIFVTDSQHDLLDENVKSYKNLIENLKEQGLTLVALPHILQYNKRDLPRLRPVDELNRALNTFNRPYFETCATTGEGVLEGLKAISQLVMQDLNRKGVVNKQKLQAPHHLHGLNRTDTVLRPIVGPASDIAADLTTVLEELDIEADKPSARRLRPARFEPETEFDADDVFSRRRGKGMRERSRRPAQTGCFSPAFEDRDLADEMFALEKATGGKDDKLTQKLARDLFMQLIEDTRFFPPDMTESSRISMLGISLRKYAHFYRLLSQGSLNRGEALFLLHFVVDVHFCKDMP